MSFFIHNETQNSLFRECSHTTNNGNITSGFTIRDSSPNSMFIVPSNNSSSGGFRIFYPTPNALFRECVPREEPGPTGPTGPTGPVCVGGGQVQWLTKIGGSSDETPRNLSVIPDPNGGGGVYVSGISSSNPIEVYDAQFTNGTTGPTGALGTPYSMAGDGGRDNYIVKYDTDGQVQWLTKIGGGLSEFPDNLSVIPDPNGGGGVYVSGFSTSNPIEVYDAQFTNGTTGPTGALGTPYSMTGDTGFNTSDNYIVKYDTDGQVQWLTKIGGGLSEFPRNLSVIPDPNGGGGVYVSGYSSSNPIEVYDAQFTNGTTGPTGALGTPYSMTGDSGGGFNTIDNYIVKYDTDGQVQWLTKIGGGFRETLATSL